MAINANQCQEKKNTADFGNVSITMAAYLFQQPNSLRGQKK